MSSPSGEHGHSLERKRSAAFRGLLLSALAYVIVPFLIYRELSAHVSPGSGLPLVVSGLLPLAGLLWSLRRRQALDTLALFSVVQVAISLAVYMFARTPKALLLGRCLHSAAVGVLCLVSLVTKKPLMVLVARQFGAGDDPVALARFDRVSALKVGQQTYAFMTLVWALVLLAVCALSIASALCLSTTHFLLVSAALTYGSYTLLLFWSFKYAHSRLGTEYERLGGRPG